MDDNEVDAIIQKLSERKNQNGRINRAATLQDSDNNTIIQSDRGNDDDEQTRKS